ncbi:hypothetical protein RDABS01_024310 [Bienertia sinuspersici]
MDMEPNFLFIFLIILLQTISNTIVSAQSIFPAILILGDSAVDAGNNNFIAPIASPNRADHPPYGRDFPNHKPTDLLADTIGLKESVPPFLDPRLSDKELTTGVSFGSAGSGFDDLTSLPTGAIPMSKQVGHLRKYIARIERIVGERNAKEIIRKAIVLINSGTNDFVISYYDLPSRRLQYNMTGYQDFVLRRLQSFVEEIHELGCRRIVVAGLPPIGCLPIQITTRFKIPTERKCLEDQNSDATSYNQKLKKLLPHVQASLPGTRILYADVYTPIMDLVTNPKDNGFKVTDRGCCGTGYLETGSLCNVLTPTCKNASEFIFWDSAHPTEAVYQYVHDYLLEELGPQLVPDPKFSDS